jgi:hypothetical protein
MIQPPERTTLATSPAKASRVERYRGWFKLFWFRGDAAFAKPEIHEYCEEQRLTYFIRLPANENLDKLLAPHLGRPVGRPPRVGGMMQDEFHTSQGVLEA